MKAAAVVLLLSATVIACADDDAMPEQAGDRAPSAEYLTTPEFEAMGLPFSEAVRVGHMLYLSGQIGNRPGEMAVVEGGVQAETIQTMENIRSVLERYGSSLSEVVRCLIMIEDMAEWPAMNEVYAPFFPDHKPARSALGADGLALGARVEIQCTATVGTEG